jgi:hypothetical protein
MVDWALSVERRVPQAPMLEMVVLVIEKHVSPRTGVWIDAESKCQNWESRVIHGF